MANADEIQLELCRREIGDANLKRLADAIATLETRGIRPKDVFPLGIVIQDGAGVTFDVPSERLGEVVQGMADLRELRPEIRISSVGILVPDSFEVRTTIGRVNR